MLAAPPMLAVQKVFTFHMHTQDLKRKIPEPQTVNPTFRGGAVHTTLSAVLPPPDARYKAEDPAALGVVLVSAKP